MEKGRGLYSGTYTVPERYVVFASKGFRGRVLNFLPDT